MATVKSGHLRRFKRTLATLHCGEKRVVRGLLRRSIDGAGVRNRAKAQLRLHFREIVQAALVAHARKIQARP